MTQKESKKFLENVISYNKNIQTPAKNAEKLFQEVST